MTQCGGGGGVIFPNNFSSLQEFLKDKKGCPATRFAGDFNSLRQFLKDKKGCPASRFAGDFNSLRQFLKENKRFFIVLIPVLVLAFFFLHWTGKVQPIENYGTLSPPLGVSVVCLKNFNFF